MKVGDTFNLVPTQASQRTVGTATTSFATLLASGRSVVSIRSERAFGFSETGLLGATRSTNVNAAPNARPRAFEASELPRAQSTQARSPNDRKSQPANGPVVKGSSGPESAITDRANVQPSARGKSPSAASHGHPSKTDSRSNYSKSPQRSSLIINADRWLPAEKRQRRLLLSGSDDALSISIHEFSNEEHQESELFFVFSTVAQQFGMTLSFIRLQKLGFNLKLESGRV